MNTATIARLAHRASRFAVGGLSAITLRETKQRMALWLSRWLLMFCTAPGQQSLPYLFEGLELLKRVRCPTGRDRAC